MACPDNGRKALKVWHLAELYPPSYGGGAALYVRDVCRSLARRGHEVRVLCTDGGAGPDYSINTDYDGAVRIDRMSLAYFRERDPGGWHLGIRGWKEHRRRVVGLVERLLDDWTPDVVQFHTPYSLYEESFPALKRRGLPITGMLHCSWLICPRLGLMRSPTGTRCDGPAPLKCLECLYSHWDGSRAKALVKLPWRLLKLGGFPAYRLWTRSAARRGVAGLLGPSRFITDVHRRHVRAPVAHVPLGVDLAGLPPERPRRPRSPLRFGFLGGFQEHKGVWDVLDAAAKLKRSGLPFELHVWGPGHGPEAVRERDLNDRVTLHGVFSPEQKWAVFERIDVLLVASRVEESFGRVVQEAAAAGVPTVAAAAGGIVEQIRHGHDGLLYEFQDASALGREMARLVEDPARVRTLSDNLWTVIDTRDVGESVEAFYYQLIDGHRATARPPRSRRHSGALNDSVPGQSPSPPASAENENG